MTDKRKDEEIYRENMDDSKKQSKKEEVVSTTGWQSIKFDDMPSKGLFNFENEKVKIKSADFKDIKHYSSINEDDPNDVDQRVNEILLKNCKVGVNGDYRDLGITDKLHIFFSIRDWTLMNNNSKNEVYMTFASSKGEKKKIKVDKDIFEYYDIPEHVMKWYNKEEKCFIIDDDPDDIVKIYVPRMGTIEHIKKYIRNTSEKKKNDNSVFLDKDFTLYVQYMISDWRKLDDDFEEINKLYTEYKNWSLDKHQIFDAFVSYIKLGIKPNAKVKFSDGNSEVFPINFRGYKSLFHISSRLKVLLGDNK